MWRSALAFCAGLAGFVPCGGHISGNLFEVELVEGPRGRRRGPLEARINGTQVFFVVLDGFDRPVLYSSLRTMHQRRMHLVLVHADGAAAVMHLHPASVQGHPEMLVATLPAGFPHSGLYYLMWSFLVEPSLSVWTQALIQVPNFCIGKRTLISRLRACGVSERKAQSMSLYSGSSPCEPERRPPGQDNQELLTPNTVERLLTLLGRDDMGALQRCLDVQRYGGFATRLWVQKGPAPPAAQDLPLILPDEPVAVWAAAKPLGADLAPLPVASLRTRDEAPDSQTPPADDHAGHQWYRVSARASSAGSSHAAVAGECLRVEVDVTAAGGHRPLLQPLLGSTMHFFMVPLSLTGGVPPVGHGHGMPGMPGTPGSSGMLLPDCSRPGVPMAPPQKFTPPVVGMVNATLPGHYALVVQLALASGDVQVHLGRKLLTASFALDVRPAAGAAATLAVAGASAPAVRSCCKPGWAAVPDHYGRCIGLSAKYGRALDPRPCESLPTRGYPFAPLDDAELAFAGAVVQGELGFGPFARAWAAAQLGRDGRWRWGGGRTGEPARLVEASAFAVGQRTAAARRGRACGYLGRVDGGRLIVESCDHLMKHICVYTCGVPPPGVPPPVSKTREEPASQRSLAGAVLALLGSVVTLGALAQQEISSKPLTAAGLASRLRGWLQRGREGAARDSEVRRTAAAEG